MNGIFNFSLSFCLGKYNLVKMYSTVNIILKSHSFQDKVKRDFLNEATRSNLKFSII